MLVLQLGEKMINDVISRNQGLIKRSILMSGFIGLALSCTQSYAEITWAAKAALNVKTIDFESETDSVTRVNFSDPEIVEFMRLASIDTELLSLSSNINRSYDAQLLALDLSVTASVDSWYVSIGVEPTIADDYVSSDFVNNYSITDSSDGSTIADTTGNIWADYDISRYDYSATVGYKFEQNITLFGGYKYGETTEEYQVDFVILEHYLPNDFDSTFEESGLFIGGAYTLPFDDIGALTFSAAYAFMENDYKESGNYKAYNVQRYADDPIEGGFPITKINYKGDATGLSLVASWGGALTQQLRYHVTTRFNEYKYDADGSADISFSDAFMVDLQNQLDAETAESLFDDDPTNNFSGSVDVHDVTATISITTLSAGLLYIF